MHSHSHSCQGTSYYKIIKKFVSGSLIDLNIPHDWHRAILTINTGHRGLVHLSSFLLQQCSEAIITISNDLLNMSANLIRASYNLKSNGIRCSLRLKRRTAHYDGLLVRNYLFTVHSVLHVIVPIKCF